MLKLTVIIQPAQFLCLSPLIRLSIPTFSVESYFLAIHYQLLYFSVLLLLLLKKLIMDFQFYSQYLFFLIFLVLIMLSVLQ